MQATLTSPSSQTVGDAVVRKRKSFFPTVARGFLLLMLLVIYSGAMPYLILASPLLLYAVYCVLLGSAALILFFDWPQVREFRGVAPYVGWVLFFCYWGALVAPPEMPLDDVLKTALKTVLVIGGLALAVNGMPALRRFAGWVQVLALMNAGIAIWQTDHPEMIRKMALAHDPNATAFNVERPAGIWSNPDEAGYGYLFALLLSCWVRGPLAWIGRIACLVGIFLTASRTGAYVLSMCAIILILGKLRSVRLSPGFAAGAFFGLLALGGAGVAAVKMAPAGTFDLSENRQVQRILDFSEVDARSSGNLSRTEIARVAAIQALDGPWYGYGYNTFRLEPEGPYSVLEIGAHNHYITVWGEAGVLGGVSFFILLAFGMSRLFNEALEERDRLLMLLFWMSYLVIGLTWHNQITAFAGMLYSGALWHFPGVLGKKDLNS
jgi:O-antigen ligase